MESSKSQARSQFWKRMLWIFAALTIAPPFLGLSATAAGLIGALDQAGLEGSGDPATLATNISLALMTTAGGITVSLLCLPFFVISLAMFLTRNRELTFDERQEGESSTDQPDTPAS